MNERQELFDRLCRILTDYEEKAPYIYGHQKAEKAFYEILTEIQNKWDTVIIAEE